MTANEEAKKEATRMISGFMPFANSLNVNGPLIRGSHLHNAKQCALICVDERLKEAYKQGNAIALERQDFLLSVKQEIKNYKP